MDSMNIHKYKSSRYLINRVSHVPYITFKIFGIQRFIHKVLRLKWGGNNNS